MESKFRIPTNGTELQKEDLDLLGETAALADDRTLAELLRVPPYTGTVLKAVLGFGHPSTKGAIVEGNGASGNVKVNPFRAIIGPRTAVGTDAKKSWRDIRSGIYVGTTTLHGTQAIAANASGNPRWDLIYATVAVEANGPSVTRYQKDATTKLIASASIATTLVNTVTIGIVAGTAAASPAFPSTPGDSGGSYVIPLAYVRVPNGFGASSTVAALDILHAETIYALSRVTGAQTLQPANKNAGGALGATRIGTWGSSGARPGWVLPPGMVGAESRIIEIDVQDASSANWSHASLATVDDSLDWGNRLFRWTAYVINGKFVNDRTLNPADPHVPNTASAHGVSYTYGMGQSFIDDYNVGTNKAGVVDLTPAKASAMAAATVLGLYVDNADSGKLKVFVSGAPTVRAFIWLDASAPHPNY